jgi:hypothetical protein
MWTSNPISKFTMTSPTFLESFHAYQRIDRRRSEIIRLSDGLRSLVATKVRAIRLPVTFPWIYSYGQTEQLNPLKFGIYTPILHSLMINPLYGLWVILRLSEAGLQR